MDMNDLLRDFGNASKNLHCLENYLGWGDPYGGLWIVGIEEAFNWAADVDKTWANLKIYMDLMDNGKRWDYDQTSSDYWNQEKPWFNNQRLRYNISKICLKFCEQPPPEFEDYFANMVFREGSKVFSCNLFPIGKRRIKEWPEAYEQLFGISAADASKYYEHNQSPESERGQTGLAPF